MKHVYLAFAIIVMITCWESNRTNAAVLTPIIPEESIRIRILANSDSVQDQALKGQIRDAVASNMQSWANGPQTIEQARAVIRAHMPELDILVGDMIRDRGFPYKHQVELGVVPFPAKMFANEQVPAGDYEALRITIGSGKGQNWWCVLFPPLCFVDAFTSESAARKGSDEAAKKKLIVNLSQAIKQPASQQAAINQPNAGQPSANQSRANGPSAKQTTVNEPHTGQPASAQPANIEVRFFLWDLLHQVGSWFK
jgi:stage II sporulation protein R